MSKAQPQQPSAYFTMRLPADMLAELHRIAQDDERAVSAVVRRIIRDYLDGKDSEDG